MSHDRAKGIPQNGDGAAQGVLQSAIAYLRRGLRTDGTYEGADEWDLANHQWRILVAWAESAGLILPPSVCPEREGGREHDVRHLPAHKQWLKFTKPNAAGYAVEVVDDSIIMLPATPLQYLQRCAISNEQLSDNIQLVGIADAYGDRRIVVSQPDVVGPPPSWEEIHQTFVSGYELQPLKTPALLAGYDARCYFRGRVGVFDVRPANCARVAPGLVKAFDVIPQFFNHAASTVLRRHTV